MNSYRDLFYPERTALKNGEEIRHVYCLHVINHVLKANAQVLGNNSRRRSQKLGVGDDDDFRDQGLTRPKVSGSRRALPSGRRLAARHCRTGAWHLAGAQVF